MAPSDFVYLVVCSRVRVGVLTYKRCDLPTSAHVHGIYRPPRVFTDVYSKCRAEPSGSAGSSTA
jgi:hypothetical protein